MEQGGGKNQNPTKPKRNPAQKIQKKGLKAKPIECRFKTMNPLKKTSENDTLLERYPFQE